MKNILYIITDNSGFFAQNGFEKGMLCIKRENTSKLLTPMEVC
jgi:hypothetical protein